MKHRSSSHSNKERGFHLDEHLCLDLILGFLSPEEEERIFLHLSACPICEKLLQEKAAEGAHLEATRVLKTGPGGKFFLDRRGTAVRMHDFEWEKHRPRDFLSRLPTTIWSGFRKPQFRLAGGLAAAAAVLLLIVWIYNVRAPGPSHLHTLPPYSFQLRTRETAETVACKDLEAGLEAYNNKDFKHALEFLELAGSSELGETHETVRKIYLGSALAWRGKYRQAVEVLERVPLSLVPGEWGGEAQWTLYVAYRKTGREVSADSLLKILAVKPGGIGERASGLLQWELQE